MRYKLINVEGDNLYGGSVVYNDEMFEASDDGIGYYHHPASVRSSFYIAEIHPLFNASTAGSQCYNRYSDYRANDITLNQLRSYTK